MVMPYHLHMPSYFLETFTEYPYLDVLKVLEGHSFVYFTSNKSSIIELCEWIGANKTIGNPFEGCTKREFNAHMNYSSGYTDIMLFKKQDSYIDKMAA